MRIEARSIIMVLVGITFGVAFMLTCESGPGSADAQDAGTNTNNSGDCCQISGPLQMTPASENPQQLVRGVHRPTNVGYSVQAAEGPLVVTSARILGDCDYGCRFHLLAVPAADGCPNMNSIDESMELGQLWGHDTYRTWINGSRLPVQAGELLCIYRGDSSGDAVAWSGFRPY